MGNNQSELMLAKKKIVELEEKIRSMDPAKRQATDKQLLELERRKAILEQQSWLIEGSQLDDIVGLENVVNILKAACILPQRQPQIFNLHKPHSSNSSETSRESQRRTIEPLRKLLLYGPPGTGKTMLAKAAAEDSGATFFRIDMATLGSKYYYETEERLAAEFDKATKKPLSVIFMDEIDSLGQKRKEDEQMFVRNQKNTLLQRLDSLPSNVIFIGCTNHLSQMDSALVRRFDIALYVRLPDKETRKQMLIKFIQPDSLSEGDIDDIAENTVLYSGAELKALITKAKQTNLEEWLCATHFKKSPAHNDRYIPCDLTDDGAEAKSIINLPHGTLASPPSLTKRSVQYALSYIKPTSKLEDVIKEAPDYMKADLRELLRIERESDDREHNSNNTLELAAAKVLTSAPQTISLLTNYIQTIIPVISQENLRRVIEE